jgi:phage terminase large subunit
MGQLSQTNFIPAFLPFLQEKARFKLAWGGRGSGKSEQICHCKTLRGYEKKQKILNVREVQKSIEDSVMSLYERKIRSLGLPGFDIQKTKIYHQNGSEYLFKGLSGTTEQSIKSIDAVNSVWIEEGQTITQSSLDILIPSIRSVDGGEPPEIWASMNRLQELDPLYKLILRECDDEKNMRFITPEGKEYRWIEYRGADCIALNVNWDGNPFFPPELEAEKEKCRLDDPEGFIHIWQGEPIGVENSLISKIEVNGAIDRVVEKINVPVVVGWDVAEEGDYNAVWKRDGNEAEMLDRFKGVDPTDAVYRVADLCFNHKVDRIVVDSVGVGSGPFSLLKKVIGGSVDVVDIKAGWKADDSAYANAGTECWNLMKEWLKAGRIPNDTRLKDQLTSRRELRKASGQKILESKKVMRSNGFDSPDDADALAFTFFDLKATKKTNFNYETQSHWEG